MRILLVFVVVIFIFFSTIPISFAQYNFLANSGLEETGIETGHVALPISTRPLSTSIGYIISAVLSFLGIIFLFLIIYGGFIWMLARGNETDVAKAKNIIQNSLIGLIVVIAAFAVSWFLTDVLLI